MIRHADHADDGPPPRPDLDGSTMPPLDAAGGPADRDERLGEAIEAYLERAEGGAPPDPEAFAAGYPDLGDDLVAALEGLALVKGLVGGPAGPGHRLEEGRRVAGYRIVRELGRGGMGVVYEAVHVGLDRPVALKVLGSQATPDSSGRRRFLNEARTAAGLHHTHIVPVFDVGQVGGLCYYAMQRIEGSGLDRVLKALRRDRTVASGSTVGSSLRPKGSAAGGPPSRPVADLPVRPAPSLADDTLSWTGGLGGGPRPARWGGAEEAEGPAFAPPRGSSYYRWVADVGRQAAEALAHAHQRGIIHRDIKPSNLLVDARGIIWVADFGLARRLADPSQTQVDSLLGTPRYMSPEQARTGAIDGRADVYSLGATLYELITLRPPFDGQTAAELIEQIGTREPVAPRRFDPRVPLDLETILLKALAKRPADRYAGARELADDLARFLAHEPVKARRIGPVGRAWRFARRHPASCTVSALAASVVLTTATVAYRRILDERNRADGEAKYAMKAKAETDLANRGLEAQMLKTLEQQVKGLEQQAGNVLRSSAPDHRADGLELVRQAAELSGRLKPEPDRLVRLRDQAVEFLTLRDVEARPAIEVPDGPRRGLAFDPTGRRVATLDAAGELSLWDVDTLKPVDTPHRPAGPARPNGGGGGGGGGRGFQRGPGRAFFGSPIAAAGEQFLIVQPREATVRWFDAATHGAPTDEEIAIPGQRGVSVLAAADGRHFLTVGQAGPGEDRSRPPGGGRPDRFDAAADDPRVCLWDRKRAGEPRATLSLPPPRPDANPALNRLMLVAYAPDGSRVAACRAGDPEVSLWDDEGRRLPPVALQGSLQGYPTAMAIGPNGMLAVGNNVGDVALWDLSTAQARGTPAAGGEAAPDASAKPLPGIDLHQYTVGLLRFGGRDGSLLAAAGLWGGIELWDLTTRMPIATLKTGNLDDLAFAPDGRTLAAGLPGSIALWSLVEPAAQVALPESGDSPTGLAFGPGDVLAIASRDANFHFAPVQLWGGPGQCPPAIASWPECRPTSVGFDAGGRLISPEPGAIRWYRPPGATPEAEVEVPADDRPERRGEGGATRPPPTRILARSADGSTLLILRSERVFFWRAADPGALAPLEPSAERGGFGVPRGVIPSLALSPDGRTLYQMARRPDGPPGRRGEAGGPAPGSWTLAARPVAADGPHQPAWVQVVPQAYQLALTPDGRTLALGTVSGEVELRDARDGSTLAVLPAHADAGSVESLAFAPDGRTLAVGGREQIRLWDVARPAAPAPVVRLPGYRALVRALAFDSTGGRLAGADEKTVKVWDLGGLRDELDRFGLGW